MSSCEAVVDGIPLSPVSVMDFPRDEVMASGLAAGEDTPFFWIVAVVSFFVGLDSSTTKIYSIILV